MKSAITVSLVPEAIHGPFLFHGDVPAACRVAKDLGFDGIELFAPGPDTLPAKQLKTILDDHGLELAAVGTGAGWLQQKLSLTSPDASVRSKAIDFIARMIDYAAAFDAPAIIGSMQGRHEGNKTECLAWLAEALVTFNRQTPRMLIYEPLNRYETNLLNTLADAEVFLSGIEAPKVMLLADLFHMNIEEANLGLALEQCDRIGHVHIADSNRGPAGSGHTDFEPIADAIRFNNYNVWISAEAFPKPDPLLAAKMTIRAFQKHFSEFIGRESTH